MRLDTRCTKIRDVFELVLKRRVIVPWSESASYYLIPCRRYHLEIQYLNIVANQRLSHSLPLFLLQTRKCIIEHHVSQRIDPSLLKRELMANLITSSDCSCTFRLQLCLSSCLRKAKKRVPLTSSAPPSTSLRLVPTTTACLRIHTIHCIIYLGILTISPSYK
jgi:hypothetical protein